MEVREMAEGEQEFEPTKDDLRDLREWISKSPYIVQDYDEKVLSAIVRGCKGRLQKAKKVIEAFNSLGQRYPHIMQNYDPLDQRLVEHLSEALVFPLPQRTPDGCNVWMTQPRHYEGFKSDPYNTHATDFFRYWFLSLYIYLWTNDFGSGKWILVSDLKHSNLIRVRELTPISVKQIVEITQNAMPIRFQGYHMINMPPFLEHLLNLAKSMMKKKLSERMYFHSSMDTVYEKIPKEILPIEYGGSEKGVLTLHDRWYEKVKSFRKELLEEESKMRKLDPLRPKSDQIQEMDGTFRTLNVD